MREWYFIWIYGATFILGVFLSIFWTERTVRYGRTAPSWTEAKVILCGSLALLTIGITITDSARSFGNIHYGLSTLLQRTEGTVIGVGLLFTFIASLGFVLLADLESRPPNWRWFKIMALLTALWAVASRWVAHHAPLVG